VQIAEQTERDIDVTRSQYIPVAVNTQILFFCVSDLSNIDPMYQYSLEWFITIFLHGIANAEKSGTVYVYVLTLASCLIYARALLEYVLFILWVRSVSKMLPYVKFAEDKVLTFCYSL